MNLYNNDCAGGEQRAMGGGPLSLSPPLPREANFVHIHIHLPIMFNIICSDVDGETPASSGILLPVPTVVQAPSCTCGAKRRGIWGLSIGAKKQRLVDCRGQGPRCAGGSCDVLLQKATAGQKTILGTNGACYLEPNGRR